MLVNFFRDEPEILLSNHILDDLNNRFDEYYSSDTTLLSSNAINIDFDNFSYLPNGKIKFTVNHVCFDCFFKKGKKKLYVFFPFARGTPGSSFPPYPRFARWSYYFSGYSCLSVDDPMYNDYPLLGLGWMWGDKSRNYREYFSTIVSKIIKYLGLSKDDVVFFGSSGGGTCAIHTASLFGGGTVIAINPQLNFEYETHNKKLFQFKSTTGIDIFERDPFNRNNMLQVIQNSKNTKFLIVENLFSDWDRLDHLNYFTNKINFTPSYGLSYSGNIFFWLYYAKNKRPHSAVEDKNIFWGLDFIASSLKNTYNIDSLKQFVLMINQFWFSGSSVFCVGDGLNYMNKET